MTPLRWLFLILFLIWLAGMGALASDQPTLQKQIDALRQRVEVLEAHRR